ncbi:MAG: YqgE/AlgH family protein [Planctomycetaceae bacterium]
MPDTLRGQFLIAGRTLRDPNFYQTVVLVVEHNDGGAMGVVINRPSGVTVAQSLQKHFDLVETGEMVYLGGPVERNALFVLHNAAELDTAESPVIEGLFVGGSAEAFEEVVKRAADSDPDLRFRVYFGCAGWGPGQLEGELTRNDWHVSPASLDPIFSPDPYSVWESAVGEFRRTNSLVPGTDMRPELN